MDENTKKQSEQILNNFQVQIRAFDTKASILIAVISISFSVILNLFYKKELLNFTKCLNIIYTVLFILLFLIGLASVILFVGVIFPRKKNKKDFNIYANYYIDMHNKRNDEIKASLIDFTYDEDLLLNQIRINSHICYIKHQFLKYGIILLGICSGLLIVLMTINIIVGL